MEKYTLKPRKEGESIKKAEPVLKRKQHDLELLSRKAKRRAQVKKNIAKQKKNVGLITPSKLVHQALVKQLDAKRFRNWIKIRDKVNLKVLYKNTHKILLVVRNQRYPPSKMSSEILNQLNLSKFWSAILLPNDLSSLLTLKSIEPFVMYGYIQDNQLRKLFNKYLRLKTGKTEKKNKSSNEESIVQEQTEKPVEERIEPQINIDNAMIEACFGHLGIICLEDLIEEVKTCSTNFKEIVAALEPFQLQNVRKPFDIDTNYVEFGNLKFELNDRIESLV